MKIRLYILIVLILLAAVLVPPAMAGSAAQDREQKIKAAFLYNFINFVDWPEDKMTDNDEPIIIGVIGNKDLSSSASLVIKILSTLLTRLKINKSGAKR
jgi:hypothetical protein